MRRLDVLVKKPLGVDPGQTDDDTQGNAQTIGDREASAREGIKGQSASDLQAALRDFAAEESLGLGKIAQPLRVALTGRTVSPSVFDMMEILGRDESLARIRDCEKALEKAG
jgi:glutamyl-tRNA synthetase